MYVKDEHTAIIGQQRVVESVIALKLNLIDYGETTVRSDVDAWE